MYITKQTFVLVTNIVYSEGRSRGHRERRDGNVLAPVFIELAVILLASV